jgi:hypothetical protein
MIKPQTIDLSKADGYAVTDTDLIIKRLKRDRRYKPDLMYRGFNGARLHIMLEHGTDTPDSDMIFCGNEEDLRCEGIDCGRKPLPCAFNHLKPALAVYDGSKLTIGDCCQRRRFIDPERKLNALVAVYLLQD